ncbi:MAG: rRNA maturation RNase YbeY [Lachnospiraceae bacterium]|nr:rRNA maturation RNase YbeY [Lachnospiraceae bacterium]
MTVNFENESEAILDLDAEKLAYEVIAGALDVLECPYEAEVNLLITDEEGIREINRQFRNVDAPTDVLSFPMNQFPSEGDFSFLEDDEAEEDAFNPETGELLLGDIVICASRVISQAESYGHSRKREYAFLITHSVLHLCGYDHMEDEERERMEEKQREILGKLGITR